METVNKKPHNWSMQQLTGWANNEIGPGTGITDEHLAKEVCSRIGVDYKNVDAAKQALKDFLAGAEVSTDGDVTISAKDEGAEEVTTEAAPVEEPEVEEPTPAPTPKPTEPAKPAPSAAPKVEVKVEDKSATKPANSPEVKLLPDNDTYNKMFNETISNYLTVMKPGHGHTEMEGVRAQVEMHKLFKTITKLNGVKFFEIYRQLLTVVAQHRQAHFNERYVFRHIDKMKLSNREILMFERFMHLVITTCESSKRSMTIKQIDLAKTMEFFGEEALQRMQEFYAQ